jgi:hypothetical protein
MGATASAQTSTTGEITIQVTNSSPCGSLSDPGVIGCGGGASSSGRVLYGNVWVCTCMTSDPDIYAEVLHELGHVFNLAHISGTYGGQLQVMNPSLVYGVTQYRSGDVNGLRQVAITGGLTPPTHPPSTTTVTSITSTFPNVTVEWAAAASYGHAIDSHQVEVKNMTTSSTTTVTTGTTRQKSVGVNGGALYEARVRAHNSNGWGAWGPWSAAVYATARCISSINDVPQSSTFCADIAWMLDQGITTGYDDGGFHPASPVTRQAMAAFLMRYSEILSPGSTAGDWSSLQSFNDVPSSSPFHDQIEWLASTGVTTGYDDGGFHPDGQVSRQAMAAFLMRFTEHLFPGSTAGSWSSSNSFWDVPSTHSFHDQIEWLASVGITSGYADGGFHPGTDVSRQASAAFLHRHDLDYAP